ncbi:MAG: tRNA threonylcarbamoyladenosine dehydratase [Clostridia bacterium]|nr:tRNA threonylcarbamoyladenosine dehydratase [Clostridia bacterium]
MKEIFSRGASLLGEDGIARLRASRVAVFGVGGVGGFAAEALARSGVGALDLIDHDTVSPSNINRQIIALHSTVGRKKVEVMAERIADICPDTVVRTFDTFYLPETAHLFDFSIYDYVVDAIDTVSGKIALVMQAKAAGIPIICAMGAGNKTDPSAFRVADISQTKVCPLAKVMRVELRKRGITDVKVVYSEEPPLIPLEEGVPGSLAFVPSAAGLMMAGAVVMDLADVNLDARRKGARP